ncbi:MAG: c-type cytochrome [Moraxellaceae bacterium]
MNTGLRQLALAMALLAGSAVAVAADGPALYKEHCAKCHGDTGHADNWRGNLYFARNFTKPAWQSKMSDADILEEIDDGPRIMPSFKDSLSADEKQALIHVIRGFSSK